MSCAVQGGCLQVKTELIWLVAALWISGCATVTSIDSAEHGTPLVYSGTRLDLAAIADNESDLRKFKTLPPASPWLDMPFSLVADTFMLPLTFGVAAYEWLFYRRTL
jgi:uncharacterized protein YceK